MSLSHVLLTSLLEKPSTGIDLAKRFDKSMGFFWNATHQQIYRELAQMLSKQWISTVAIQDSDARKKTYQVEPQGELELRAWIKKNSQPAKLRDELMVKLRAEAQLGGDTILPELQRHLALHRAQLALYQKILQKDQQKAQQQPLRTFLIQQKILELGIEFEIGWIKWLEQMIVLIQAHPTQQPQG